MVARTNKKPNRIVDANRDIMHVAGGFAKRAKTAYLRPAFYVFIRLGAMANKIIPKADNVNALVPDLTPPKLYLELKEITHSNVTSGSNPERLLSATGNVQSWVNKKTMIPDLLSTLIVIGEVGYKLRAVEILAAAAEAGLNTYTLLNAVGEAMKFSCGEEARKGLRKIVLGQNKRFGLPDEEVLDHWLKADSIDERGRMLFLNVKALEELHQQRPGAAKVLHDTYGISCFGRYQTKTLIRQYDSIDERPEILGLAISCRTDKGGLFYGMSDTIERLSRDFNVKVVEGEQWDELQKSLVNVKKKHKKKAQFAVVAMHADTLDSLLDQTMGRYEENWGAFMEERPTFVIVSSLVTAPGRARDRLEAHGAKVIGPSHVIHQCPVKFEYEKTPENRVKFDIDFST